MDLLGFEKKIRKKYEVVNFSKEAESLYDCWKNSRAFTINHHQEIVNEFKIILIDLSIQ